MEIPLIFPKLSLRRTLFSLPLFKGTPTFVGCLMPMSFSKKNNSDII